MSNPTWVQIALAEQGQAEIGGALHNERIIAYHATTSLRARDDETPWCASFVGWCLQKAGLPMTRSAAAASYAVWGVPLPQPVLGAVVTFTRAGGGHVGFYMGQRDGKWLILGGNQSNRVSIAAYDPARMTAIRWPAGVPLPNAVAPLSKSGVIRGSLTAGLGTVASVGTLVAENAATFDQARAWLAAGGWLPVVLALVVLAGVGWSIASRVQGKAASAEQAA